MPAFIKPAAKQLLFLFTLSALLLPGLSHSQSSSPSVEMVPQIGHSQPVAQLIHAPSGRFIISGANTSNVKLWSPDGRLLRTIDVGRYRHFSLSPDESLIAVNRFSGIIDVWTVLGEHVARMPQMTGVSVPGPIAFAPDGNSLMACSTASNEDYCQEFGLDGSTGARLDNPTNGGVKDDFSAIGYSPDGSRIYLAVGQDVHIHDRDGTRQQRIPVTDGFLASLAVSEDGSLIATGDSATANRGSVPTLRLWTSDWQLLAEFPDHPSSSLDFSPDSEWLASGGWNNNQVLIVERSGDLVGRFRVGVNSGDSPKRVAISPDRSRITTAGRLGQQPALIRQWSPDGREMRRFRQNNSAVTALDYAPKQDLIVTASGDNQLRYWALDGRLLRTHHAAYNNPDLLAIAPNGSALVSGGREITIWDEHGNAVSTIPVHEQAGRALSFSPDGNFLLTGGIDGYTNIIGLNKTAATERFIAHDGEDVTALAVHPDSNRFASGSIWGRFRLWNMQGELLAEHQPETGPPYHTLHSMQFTPDGEELAVYTNIPGREITLFGPDGTISRQVEFPVRNAYEQSTLAISADGRWLAASVNRQIGLWNLDTLELVQAFSGHGAWIDSLEFSDDGQTLVSADKDGIVRVWNVATGHSYALLADGDEWVAYTDDGYFDASRYGGDLVSMVSGLQGYSVDQFALLYNRPDVLYSRLGIYGQDIIDFFAGFHSRRLANLGRPDADSLQAPTVEIVSNRQQGKQLELQLATEIPGRKDGFLQIYVNDVPIYSGKGRKIESGSRQFTTSVELTAGRNRVEAGVISQEGIESLRVPLFAEYSPDIKGDLYFVGLGVADYKDDALDLNYADDDVRNLGALLENYNGHYQEVHRLELLNEEADGSSLQVIDRFLAAAGVDDTVVMLVSGHGGYVYDEQANYYFLPHEADPNRLQDTAIPYQALEGVLDGINPRRKLLLLDTCQSGEFDPATLAALQETATDQGLSARAREALVSKVIDAPRTYLYERDRYIYNDLSRSSGAVVFSSSLANESSIESSAIGNGIFTYALINALSDPVTDSNGDGSISVPELETAVKVSVATATGDLQHPSMERENIYQELSFPVLY